MIKTILDLNTISCNHKYALLRPIEKLFLDNCAKFLKNDSIIVEVGTFLGGASSIMAHSNPNINIFSIDQYDNYKWNPDQENLIKDASNNQSNRRTLELVKKINSKYENITFLQGVSPYDFNYWDTEIDLYIEDGTHQGKVLYDNINFWIKKIKNKGYIFLHDYRPYLKLDHHLRFIDVEKNVYRLQSEHGFTFIDFYGDYAVLQKD